MTVKGGATAAKSLEETFWTGDASVRQRGAARGRDRRAVAGGAGTGRRREEFLGDWSVEASRDRPAILDKRGGNGPIRQAGQIGARAVDRIDDPDVTRGEPSRIVDAFLRQPTKV